MTRQALDTRPERLNLKIDPVCDIYFLEWNDDPYSKRWLVEIGGLRLGPIDRECVLDLYECGNVRADDRIQLVGTKKWRCVSSLLMSSAANANHSTDSIGERASTFMIPCSSPVERITVADRSLVSPINQVQYFLRRNDQDVGPIPFETLQELADHHRIEPTTSVRSETSSIWMTAKALGLEFGPAPDQPRSLAYASQPPQLKARPVPIRRRKNAVRLPSITAPAKHASTLRKQATPGAFIDVAIRWLFAPSKRLKAWLSSSRSLRQQ